VNARELIDSLAALPGVQSVTTSTEGIEDSALVNGIEVACATSATERPLRTAWRRRTSGGPTPLLLVADDAETDGVVVVLGPVSHDGPVRLVSAGALADVLRRASTLPALQAVRDLAEQLELNLAEAAQGWQAMAGGDRNGADSTLVVALAAGQPVRQAAETAKVSERTVYRRLQDDAFRVALAQERALLAEEAVGRLAKGMTAAADTLAEIAADTAAPTTARVSAARAVLELGQRLRVELDVERRLDRLEEALQR
jgi:hypothetical protein